LGSFSAEKYSLVGVHGPEKQNSRRQQSRAVLETTLLRSVNCHVFSIDVLFISIKDIRIIFLLTISLKALEIPRQSTCLRRYFTISCHHIVIVKKPRQLLSK
jgi:hypothetical protein